MKTQSLLFIVAGAVLTTACATQGSTSTSAPAAAVPAPEPVFQCNADGARFAVGQPLSPQLEAAARVRAGAGTVRALKPGEAVTMELNGGRLNLDVDARGRVTDVRCG
ncbi:putative lipoprotein YajG [Variovorax paradoxus]|uniref:I78 family peptidase inhibitor n=1 Tax=Variovorax paradoxus TaxID=34073 RepID=UPI002794A246|nr:I78 family peptidase inhibitor [Variovorax paradoxus]MDQ0571886.1 putative lipoprotein YajG [Variovorax paradoxus]